MGLFDSYLTLCKEKNEYRSLYDSLSKLYKLSDYFTKYDLLIDQYKKIESLKSGSATIFAKNEDELIEKFINDIKKIYSKKMNDFLREESYEGSLGYMNGVLKDLNNSSSKYLNGQLQSFIIDVTRVVENYPLIFSNYRLGHPIPKSVPPLSPELIKHEPLYKEILEFTIETGKISASLIQRRFRLGYDRAARIVDLLEEEGIIGPQNGSKPREVLVGTNNLSIKDTETTEYFSVKYGNLLLENRKNIIEFIDNDINGYEFEELMKNVLMANKFENIEVTKCSGDFGVDIIAFKDCIKYAIQCKKYSSSVGVKAVQEVIASKTMNECHVAVVLTNNYFTSGAIELASKNNVLLWDRNELIKLLKNYKG